MTSALHGLALLPAMASLVFAAGSVVAAQDEVPGPEAAGNSAGNSGDSTVVVTGASQQEFPRITVQFEVRQPDGSFLLDATRADFRVTEDGKDVQVLDFQAPRTTQAIPTTIVLVVDHSGSMEQENRIRSLKQAVASFLPKLPAGSRVAVVGFSSEVERLCRFTTDRDRVLGAVNRLRPGGATRFFHGSAASLGRSAGGTRSGLFHDWSVWELNFPRFRFTDDRSLATILSPLAAARGSDLKHELPDYGKMLFRV